MPTDLKIVDSADATLFDLNDASGAANPGRVQTYFGVGGGFALNAPELTAVRFEPPSAPGGFTTSSREGLVASSWRQRMVGPSLDSLEEGVGSLQNLLRQGGILKWIPEGSSRTRYIDYEPTSAPALYQGAEMELHQLMHLFDTVAGTPIVLWRQPAVRGAELVAATNVINNPLMLLDSDVNGRPDGWTWTSTTDITAEVISTANEAYGFAIATTGTRTLKSGVVAGVATGDIWSGQFEVRASDSVTARCAAQITFLQADGTTVTATKTAGVIQLSTGWQRITVSTLAAPALTTKIRLDLVFTNASGTAVTVYVTKAQAEKSSTATLFVATPVNTSQDPTATAGRGSFIYIHGNAPAPVKIEAKGDTSAKLTDLYIGVRGSGGVRGKNSLAAFGQGAHYLQLEGGTLSNNTTAVTDASNASGPGNNVAECTHATTPTIMAKRVRVTSTAFLATRRGRFRVYMRAKAMSPSATVVQLRWGASVADPPPYVLAEVGHDTTDASGTGDYVDLLLGTITIPDTVTPISQLTFEIYTRRDAGTGNFRMDFLSLVPADRFSHIYVSPGDAEKWLGDQLVTPTSPNTLTPATLFTNSSYAELDSINDAVGTPPTGGVVYGAVRMAWEVDLATSSGTQVGALLGQIKVRNVTDGTFDLALDVKRKSGQTVYRRKMHVKLDGVAGKAYELQVIYTAATAANEVIDVYSISYTASPFVASGEWLRADTSRGTIEHVSTTKELLGPALVDGQSLWLEPGLNFVYTHSADIGSPGYNEPRSALSRVPELRFAYSPRYYQ